MIYFDHNATSPLHPAARAAWLEASEKLIGNASSLHRLGSRADAALERARVDVASLLGCNPTDIVWTSGATEANNTVIHHFAKSVTAERKELWISPIEHPSVVEPGRAHFGKNLRFLPVSAAGVVELEPLGVLLRKRKPAGVAVMAANNETGVLQPWSEIADLCREHGVPFFTDAVQRVGKLPSAGLGNCDFVSASAHKFGGPKGVGFLKTPTTTPLRPLLHGGPQEFGRRAGTENVAGVLATVAALKARDAAATSALLAAKQQFERDLIQHLPGAKVIGADAPRLWNTTMVLLPATDACFRWVVKLDKAGFAVSTGSACSSGEEKPSHVLTAMGFTPEEISRTIRISAGWETTADDYNALLRALSELLASAR
ncbi:MAG TPA: cysteine desulfurase family protein [Methylomirabilota bacterium]|nr:cysteine desulfurase family protein [Methylomirabilota bacterium]